MFLLLFNNFTFFIYISAYTWLLSFLFPFVALINIFFAVKNVEIPSFSGMVFAMLMRQHWCIRRFLLWNSCLRLTTKINNDRRSLEIMLNPLQPHWMAFQTISTERIHTKKYLSSFHTWLTRKTLIEFTHGRARQRYDDDIQIWKCIKLISDYRCVLNDVLMCNGKKDLMILLNFNLLRTRISSACCMCVQATPPSIRRHACRHINSHTKWRN